MVFQGALTDAGGGVYTGKFAMVDEETMSLGDGEAGFDIYAKNGAAALSFDDRGLIETANPITGHDGWPDAQWDPDTPDWDYYSLTLSSDSWKLVSYNVASPMSGTMDWSTMYAIETDTGSYFDDPEATAHTYGWAGTHGGGPACWDMDWSWGSEVVPLHFPGFSVEIENLGGGDYRVTMTPAATGDEETSGSGWTMETPTVASVSPNNGDQGFTLTDVVITGTDFAKGPEQVSHTIQGTGTTSQWSTAEDKNGDWSSELSLPASYTTSEYAHVTVTMEDSVVLNDFTSGSYYYYPAEYTVSTSGINLKTGDLDGDAYQTGYMTFYLDTDGDDTADVWVVQYEAFDSTREWQQDTITDSDGHFHVEGYTESSYNQGETEGTLAQVKDDVAPTGSGLTELGEAILLSVRVETGFIMLSISEMGHFLNRRLFDNQAALTSSLRPWL
jgi:hypothetical protein